VRRYPARTPLVSGRGGNASEVAATLDPSRLATLVQGAKAGDIQDYLTLAEEMEERDLHYRSVIGTRKLSIVGLDPTVTPADDSDAAHEMADSVKQNIIDRPEFAELVTNALDALGKGFSVNEIMWDTERTPWRPARYEWRDPRWFDYDTVTGRKLLLREGADKVELPMYKFVKHEPLLKSGLPIRGGFALVAAYYHLIKSFDVAGWAAFVEVFGYPIRVGKYGKNATKNDIDVLKRAVRNIGRDIGAVIPDAMAIEIVEGVKPGGSTDHFEKLAKWVDDQLSKGILGQTATTEGTPGKLGNEDAQHEVRLDIMEADARQLETTLNRDLVIPFINLNFGPQEQYPKLRIPVPRPEDINGLMDNVSKLVPLGFPVKRSELYAKLGLTEPGDDDEVLVGGSAPAEPPSNSGGTPVKEPATAGNTEGAAAAMNAASEANDELETIVEATEWEPLVKPLHDAVAELSAECNSYEEFERRLPELLARIDTAGVTRALALDMFKARALGDAEFQADE
jgi:phage gp29-like protein